MIFWSAIKANVARDGGCGLLLTPHSLEDPGHLATDALVGAGTPAGCAL